MNRRSSRQRIFTETAHQANNLSASALSNQFLCLSSLAVESGSFISHSLGSRRWRRGTTLGFANNLSNFILTYDKIEMRRSISLSHHEALAIYASQGAPINSPMWDAQLSDCVKINMHQARSPNHKINANTNTNKTYSDKWESLPLWSFLDAFGCNSCPDSRSNNE